MVASATRSRCRVERLVADAEQRLAELVDDARPAELGERIVGRPRGDHGAVRERLPRSVVVGDDHLEAARASLGDLLDRGHAAVDRQHEPAALVGQAGERLALDAVAFLEAARQVPGDVGAELAQDQDCERGGADPVGVVVAVNADLLARRDGRTDRLDRAGHVPEQERIVPGHSPFEERTGLLGVRVAAANEHARGRLADVEALCEDARIGLRAGFDRPIHKPSHGTEAVGQRWLSWGE